MPPAVDLGAYRARIHDAGPLESTYQTLSRLHLAHATAIPFENLDIHLGRPIKLDLDSLQTKLVHNHRGGYCFEQNTLFAAVLDEIGFDVTRLGARVGEGDPRALKRTHMTLLVRIDQLDYLADVGFGAGELLEPMPFRTDEPHTQYGRTFVLRRHDDMYALKEHDRTLYTFTLQPEYDADRIVANHYTSTHPDSPFVRTLTAQFQTTDTQWILRGRTLTTIDATGSRQEQIETDEQLLDLLRETFTLDFPRGTIFRSPAGA
jgi:N-hydroxyarylamine O-acetyltransferase